MAWKKGQSGNPRGWIKDKPFADAVRLALSEEEPTTKKRKLRAIADRLVDAALEGKAWAVREVMDRVDGKAVQALDATITDGSEFEDMSADELRNYLIAEAKELGLHLAEEPTMGRRRKTKPAAAASTRPKT
jgi:Family of unknown function (DUF5681)